jgi:CRISPR-associated protein Cas2
VKHVYLVCYDIADPIRWKAIFRIMKAYGDAIQLSVFRCVLTAEAHVRLLADLTDQIQPSEDKVLIADLGPLDGRAESAIEILGKPIVDVLRGPIIL